jgi:hypothetical protein
MDPVLASLPTTVCTLHPTYTFHTLNRTIRSVMQDALRFANNNAKPKTVKGLGFRNSTIFVFSFSITYDAHRKKGKISLQAINYAKFKRPISLSVDDTHLQKVLIYSI